VSSKNRHHRARPGDPRPVPPAKRQRRDIWAAIELYKRLTRSFKKLVQQHVAADPDFAEALLREGIDTMLTGDVETGKSILRDYIKETIGFEKLGEAIGTQPKSLIRMFGPRGNPQAKNLFSVLDCLRAIARGDPAPIGGHPTRPRGSPVSIFEATKEHQR
jgi:hypothetical protein